MIQPVSVKHNVENYGYLVQHEEFGKMAFFTDCSEFRYKIKDVNHWIIEANYSEEILIEHACEDNYSQSASENHLEIGQTIDALKANYSTSLQTIVLIHLSNGNSNEKQFVERVQNELGFSNVYAAKAGMTIELNKEEF